MAKSILLLAVLGLMACSAGEPPAETPGTCGPSSCPMPPSAPDPDSLCHRSVMNMTRIGLFYIAEVDPPKGPQEEALFCQRMQSSGFDLGCLERAENVMEAAKCRHAPNA